MAIPKLSEKSFLHWNRLEQDLRDQLQVMFVEEGVERVLARTNEAYSAMQLARLMNSFVSEHVDDAMEFEDFRRRQMKVLQLMIDSFVALEPSEHRLFDLPT